MIKHRYDIYFRFRLRSLDLFNFNTNEMGVIFGDVTRNRLKVFWSWSMLGNI